MGMVRTRSSYLLDVVCKYYNLKNEFEYYAYGRIENDSKTFFKEHRIMFENYKKIVLKNTEILHQNSNFGVKFFPTFGVNYLKLNPRHSNIYPPQPIYNFDSSDFLDLEIYFRIRDYDRIYFLYRKDLAEGIASYLHGKNIQSKINPENNYKKGMIFEKDEKYLVNFFQPKSKLVYTKDEINIWSIEFLLLEKYEKILCEKNIPFIKLEYNDIPNYVSNNYSNITSDLIETNWDYKNFSNFSILQSDVEESLYNLRKENEFLLT